MGPLGYFSCGSPGRSGCMGDCSRPVQPPGRVKAHDRRSRSLVWGPRTRQSAMYPFKRDRDAALAGLHEGPRVCDGRGKGGDDVENAGGAVQMRSKLQHHVATYSKVASCICNFNESCNNYLQLSMKLQRRDRIFAIPAKVATDVPSALQH